MGLLRIYSELYNSQPGIMFACHAWLQSECRATIRLIKDDSHIREYHIEGDGIPDGYTRFDLLIEELVPDVLIIKIG